MNKIGVGVIGASPLRPGWAVAAHLPALASLPSYELRGVATSNETSAQAAGQAYQVPGFADPASLIAHPGIDLVVVTVKVPSHHALIGQAIDAGKMVMSEWPLGVDLDQTLDLATRSARSGLRTLVGLQARMAPSIRYARDLVAQGYVGKVLSSTLVGSGIAWGSVSDSAHAYMFDASNNATLLSVPVMHAVDALQFVLGDLVDIRAASAIRNPKITLSDVGTDIVSTTPDQIAIAGLTDSGALVSMFYRGATSRGDNFRWEINGTQGDLVLTSPVGNLQVLAPTLLGGRGDQTTVAPLPIPPDYECVPHPPEGPAANVARLYAALARDLATGSATAPDFAHALNLQRTLDAIARASATGTNQGNVL